MLPAVNGKNDNVIPGLAEVHGVRKAREDCATSLTTHAEIQQWIRGDSLDRLRQGRGESTPEPSAPPLVPLAPGNGPFDRSSNPSSVPASGQVAHRLERKAVRGTSSELSGFSEGIDEYHALDLDCQTVVTVPRGKIQTRPGRFSVETMQRVNRALEDALGLARG